MYFQQQHYGSIAPEKPGVYRFSASHEIYSIPLSITIVLIASTYSSKPPLCKMKLIFVDVILAKGRNSVQLKVIVPGTITSESPRG